MAKPGKNYSKPRGSSVTRKIRGLPGAEQNIGRWSTFKLEYVPRIIQLGKKGYSVSQIASQLGVPKTTFYSRWMKEIPEFVDAIELAMTHAQALWEGRIDHLAVKASKGDGPKVTATTFVLRNRFRDDYHEKSSREMSGPEGVPLIPAIDKSMTPKEAAAAYAATLKRKR